MINEPNMSHCHGPLYHIKKICWSAVFAGAFVAVGLGFLLNLFSIAIGLSAFTMTDEGAATVAVGGLIGLLIGGIASMYLAGWVAGFVGRTCKHNLGVLHGFLAWSVAGVLSVLLATHVGNYINSYGQFISNPSTIGMTQDERMPTVSTTKNQNRVESPAKNDQSMIVVNMMKATNGMAMGAFVLFVLFFVGALSSSLGGYHGSESCRKCMEKDEM